jgi:hypothetical protein
MDPFSIDLLKTVLGVILASQEPLSIIQIIRLVPQLDPPIPVAKIVLDLGSVLGSGDLDDLVYILHLTFREFLLQKKRSTDRFVLNINRSHRLLAMSCLDILLQELQENMTHTFNFSHLWYIPLSIG